MVLEMLGSPHNFWELSSEINTIAHTAPNVSPLLGRLHCIQFMHSGYSCKALKHITEHQRQNSEVILWLLVPWGTLRSLVFCIAGMEWNMYGEKLVCYAGKKPINERMRQLWGYAREGHKISTNRANKVWLFSQSPRTSIRQCQMHLKATSSKTNTRRWHSLDL